MSACTESELSHSSVCASTIVSKCTPTLIRVQRQHTLHCLAPRLIVSASLHSQQSSGYLSSNTHFAIFGVQGVRKCPHDQRRRHSSKASDRWIQPRCGSDLLKTQGMHACEGCQEHMHTVCSPDPTLLNPGRRYRAQDISRFKMFSRFKLLFPNQIISRIKSLT